MWGYVVVDCMVCDMLRSMISLCMRFCMFKWKFLYCESTLWTVWDLNWFELVCDNNSVMNYVEIFYWCTGVRPDQKPDVIF